MGGGLAAPRRSRLPAGGTELTGHRDYSPGDDYRYVDWNLCARHDELLSKEYRGEADRHLYLLLDCSRSMALGKPCRLDVARKAAAAIAYCGLAGQQRASVVTFADRMLADSGPIWGKAQIGRLLRFLDAASPEPAATNLARTAEAFVRRPQRSGPAVLVSDMHDPAGFERGLQILRYHGYPPRVVRVHDRREAEPSALGDVELFDVETGSSWQVTVTEADLPRYRQLYADFCESLRSYCAKHAIPYVQVAVDLPEEELLFRTVGAKP